MLRQRILDTLRRRPYWGPQSVAREVGTSVGTVRSVASREGIAFMDRYQVEAYADKLVAAVENIVDKPEVNDRGEKV